MSSGSLEDQLAGEGAASSEADEAGEGGEGVPAVYPVVLVQMVRAGEPFPTQLKLSDLYVKDECFRRNFTKMEEV